MMRTIAIILLFLSTHAFGVAQNNPYSTVQEQKAAVMAYEIIKLYFPDVSVCDTIVGFGMPNFSGLTQEQNESLYKEWLNCLEMNNGKEIEHYSKELNTLFKNDIKKTQYVIGFSAPLHDVFCCTILPYDRKRIGISGEPVIYRFAFVFNEDGRIKQFSYESLEID